MEQITNEDLFSNFPQMNLCTPEEFWNELSPGEYNRMVQLLVEKAVVWEDRLEIELKTAGIKSLMEVIENE